MPGDAVIWLLAGVGIGIALSMLILAIVAFADRRQIRRAAAIAEVKPTVADVVPVPARPVIAKPVLPASTMVAANTVVPKPAPVSPAAPASLVEAAPAAPMEALKAKPRDMSVEALFAEAFGAAELPKAAEPGSTK